MDKKEQAKAEAKAATVGSVWLISRLVHQTSGKLLVSGTVEHAGLYEIYENKFPMFNTVMAGDKVDHIALEIVARNNVADMLRKLPEYNDDVPSPWVEIITLSYQFTGEEEWHEVTELLTDRQLGLIYQRVYNKRRWEAAERYKKELGFE